MDLAAARQHIEQSFGRMDALYLRPVFDEWAILSLAAQQGILAYSGPRAESFRKEFPQDVEPLRAMVAGRSFSPGEFEFAADAGGTRYDACLKIGDTSYLVCNHTTKEMSEIRRDPRWLNAQSAFFELCEKFRSDPLKV
jgi:hypothetical protein